MGNKIELPPVSKRLNGHMVEAEGTEVNATFVWDKKSLTWQMTDCQRASDGLETAEDPMERVVWYNKSKDSTDTKHPDEKTEAVNVIPYLVEYVEEQRGRAGIRMEKGTDLAQLASDRAITLPPGSYTLPEVYQRILDQGQSLILTVGGVTIQPAPKK